MCNGLVTCCSSLCPSKKGLLKGTVDISHCESLNSRESGDLSKKVSGRAAVDGNRQHAKLLFRAGFSKNEINM
jgi:hypothetical protein